MDIPKYVVDNEFAESLMIAAYANAAANNLLVNHTGCEGGRPTVNWYELRDDIALAIEQAIETFRQPRKVGIDHD